MAFRLSLSIRATLIARRYQPSFASIAHEDDRKNQALNDSQCQQKPLNFVQQRCFGNGFSNSWSSSGFGVLFTDRRRSRSQPSFLLISGNGSMSFCRYTSSSTRVSDVAIEAVNDSAVEAVNEVALAAAACWFPFASLQYIIDAIHSFSGFNWWSSIVMTTLLIRGATLPFLINQRKATTRFMLTLPRLQKIREQIDRKGLNILSIQEAQTQAFKLFKEYGVSLFTPLKGLFIQGLIFVSFYIATSTMAEKMPSFKSGGAYWFMDLTTPDSLYVFPVLTALTFFISVECNKQEEGLEGTPAASTIKIGSRVLAALIVPLTMSFPKAIFCYWITSNLFSITYGLVLKAPRVRKALGFPELPKQPASTASQPSFDLSATLKQFWRSQESTRSSPVEPANVSNQRISSSTINDQGLTNSKKTGGRKKNKRR